MILQCDQCNTKFKLDDSKIKEGGVKVRCSKCKHVFTVTKESQEEVADFDALLSGLGSTAAGPGVSAAASEDDETLTPGAAGPHVDPSLEKEILAEAARYVADNTAVDDDGFDFSDFNLGTESDGEAETAKVTVGKNSVPEDSNFDLGEFDFSGDDAPATSDTTKANPAVAKTADSAGYNDFTFSEDTLSSPADNDGDSPAAGGIDFGDLTFGEPEAVPAPVAQGSEANASDAGSDFEFDSLAFDAPGEAALPGNEENSAPFGEIPDPFADDDAMAFSEVDATPPAKAVSQDFADEPGDFAFDFSEEVTVEEPVRGEPAAAFEVAASDEIPEFSFSDAPPAESPGMTAMDAHPGDKVARFDPLIAADDSPFAAIDFGPIPSVAVKEEMTPLPDIDNLINQNASVPGAAVSTETTPLFEDQMPPLSIASRRKGRSFVTVASIAVSILGLVILAGSGIFFLKKEPAVFQKLGLGSVATLFGISPAEDGRISVKSPNSQFVVNKVAGELFVVSGEAVNEYKTPRASIQVKASLFGKNGVIAMQKVVYCGNKLTKEQLETLPLEKLDAAMNNQFGDSLSNLGVQSGKSIPFVVIFSKVPQDVTEFGVDVAGSTVASP